LRAALTPNPRRRRSSAPADATVGRLQRPRGRQEFPRPTGTPSNRRSQNGRAAPKSPAAAGPSRLRWRRSPRAGAEARHQPGIVLRRGPAFFNRPRDELRGGYPRPTSFPRSAQAPTWTSPRPTRSGQSRPQRPLPSSLRAFASPLRRVELGANRARISVAAPM
jgi:hypothetical protein